MLRCSAIPIACMPGLSADVVHLASRDVVSAQIEVLSYDGRTVTTVIYCTIEKGATTAVATRTGAH
jgi:hypothetical protein